MASILRPVQLAALALLALSAPALADVNLVQNPGFETGNLTGWTGPADGTVYVGGSQTAEGVHSGTYAAFFFEDGSLSGISQVIATAPGQAYTFSFWFASDGDTPNEFQAYFGGTEVFDAVNAPASGYTLESFTVTASSASSTIALDGRDDNGFLALDDVSVVAAPAAVPEPATLALLGGTLLGVGAFRRRYR